MQGVGVSLSASIYHFFREALFQAPLHLAIKSLCDGSRHLQYDEISDPSTLRRILENQEFMLH